MASNSEFDRHRDHEPLFKHNDSSETLSDGDRGQPIGMQEQRGFWPPIVQAAVPLVSRDIET